MDLFSSDGRSAISMGGSFALPDLPIDVLAHLALAPAQDLGLDSGTDWAPRDVLVPQFSTDDISTPPQLCIGCSQGRSSTQHASKKESSGRPQQHQQHQIRAFHRLCDCRCVSHDCWHWGRQEQSSSRRCLGVNMVGDLAVFRKRSAHPIVTLVELLFASSTHFTAQRCARLQTALP